MGGGGEGLKRAGSPQVKTGEPELEAEDLKVGFIWFCRSHSRQKRQNEFHQAGQEKTKPATGGGLIDPL